jgi:hypothetical protein
MIWPRRKRKKPTPEQVSALRAKVHADLQLKNVERRHTEAVTLVERLREIREENHFGQALESVNWGKQ